MNNSANLYNISVRFLSFMKNNEGQESHYSIKFISQALIGSKELAEEVNNILSNIEHQKISGLVITSEGDVFVPPTFTLHNNDCNCKSCILKESDYMSLLD